MRYIPTVPNEITHEWLIQELYRIGDQISAYDGTWDDMRFPATAINPPGLASDPGFDTTYGAWLFSGTATELLYLAMQIPHDWVVGSPLKPHVHWEKTTSASGNVYWRMEYYWHKIGEVVSGITTLNTQTVASGTPDTDTADKHLITPFSEITTEGIGISDVMTIILSRIGGDALDTYNADARMLEFDIHYQKDHGSELEFVKE